MNLESPETLRRKIELKWAVRVTVQQKAAILTLTGLNKSAFSLEVSLEFEVNTCLYKNKQVLKN